LGELNVNDIVFRRAVYKSLLDFLGIKPCPKKRFFIPQYGTSLWYDAVKQVKEESNDAKCASDNLRKIKFHGGYHHEERNNKT
jgi:hypothetical protein